MPSSFDRPSLLPAGSGNADTLRALKAIARVIPQGAFLQAVDTDGWLDEEETIEDLLACDPELLFWRAKHRGIACFGVQSMGVDQLFVSKEDFRTLSEDPTLPVPDDELGFNALAWVLEPPQSPAAFSRAGHETVVWETPRARRLVNSAGCSRYQLFERGRVIAGAFILAEDDSIGVVYTRPTHRRQGLSRQLLRLALRDHGNLKHSSSLTGDGEVFSRGTLIAELAREPEPDTALLGEISSDFDPSP